MLIDTYIIYFFLGYEYSKIYIITSVFYFLKLLHVTIR